MKDFQLMKGDVLLLRLGIIEVRQPYFVCKYEATPAFEDVKPLLDEKTRIIDEEDYGKESYPTHLDIAMDEIDSRIESLNLRLISMQNQQELADFGLWIDGEEVWLRLKDFTCNP